MAEKSKVNRRNLLKASTAAATISSFSVSTASADKSSKYYLGKVNFVQTEYYHQGVGFSMSHDELDLFDYAYNEKDGMLTVASTPINEFRNTDAIIDFRGSFFGFGELPLSQQSNDIVYVTDNQFSRSQIFVDNGYERPSLSVDRNGAEEIVAEVGGESITVSPGETREMTFESRSVNPIKMESSIEVTPVFRVHNGGKVDLYGGEDKRIFPSEPETEKIKQRVNNYRKGAQKGHYEGDENNGLFVMEYNSDTQIK